MYPTCYLFENKQFVNSYTFICQTILLLLSNKSCGKVRPKRNFQDSSCVDCSIFCNFAACETSLKERFTTLSNKNPPERERFKGNLSTYKMCLGVPNHSYLPIDRMTLLLALSTTEESSRAKSMRVVSSESCPNASLMTGTGTF